MGWGDLDFLSSVSRSLKENVYFHKLSPVKISDIPAAIQRYTCEKTEVRKQNSVLSFQCTVTFKSKASLNIPYFPAYKTTGRIRRPPTFPVKI